MEAYLESVEKQARDLLERAHTLIVAEKKIRGLSNKNLANLTGISEDAIKNFCAGKTLKNAGYIIVTALAKALNIDLNYLADYQPTTEPESAPILPIIETTVSHTEDIIKAYEKQIEVIVALGDVRVADVERSCEARIADLKQSHEERIQELKEVLTMLK